MHAPQRKQPGIVSWFALVVHVLIALTAVFVLATGCTSAVPGQPLAEGDSSPLTGSPPATAGQPPPNPAAATGAWARSVDPCALLDATAAAEITGPNIIPISLMPTETNLAKCQLALAPADKDLLSLWRLEAAVAAPLDSQTRASTTPVQIEGMSWLKLEQPDGRACRYINIAGGAPPASSTPGTEGTAGTGGGSAGGSSTAGEKRLDLTVRRDDPKPQPKSPCVVGQEYLAKLAGRWQRPALRVDRLTEPPLPIGSVDPCAALATIDQLRDTGPIATNSTLGPYECLGRVIDPEQAKKIGALSVRLNFTRDPRADKDPGLRKATVGGKPAVVKEKPAAKAAQPPLGNAGGCTVEVIADEAVSLTEFASSIVPPSYQMVRAEATTCDLATAAAEAVLAAIR